jgi:hypothetical protein
LNPQQVVRPDRREVFVARLEELVEGVVAQVACGHYSAKASQHHHGDGDRVGWSPRARLDAVLGVLSGQFVRALRLLHPGVDACGEGVQRVLQLARQAADLRLQFCLSVALDSGGFVLLKGAAAHKLCHLAARLTTVQLHLPQSVLRNRVAVAVQQSVLGVCLHGGHAITIAGDAHGVPAHIQFNNGLAPDRPADAHA